MKKMTYKFWGVMLGMLLLSHLGMAQFTPGNLVVEQVGDGSTALSGNATTVKLLQFTPTGTAQTNTSFFGSSGTPTNSPYNLVESGSATSNGYISLSTDKAFVVVPGYNAPNTTASIAASSAATYGRTIGKALPYGTTFTNGTFNALTSNNYRSIASDGSKYYLAGAAGIVYISSDATTGIATTPTATIFSTNTRNIVIFNNTVFVSTSSSSFNGTGSNLGIYQVGSFNSLPTSTVTAGTATNIINVTSSGSPYGFAFSPDGLTCYVADDRASSAGGIQKWTYSGTFSTSTGWSGGTWSLSYTLGTGSSNVGARGLTVDFSGSNPIIYGTSAEGSNAVNRVFKITDTGASSTATTLATATTNYIFRGICFAPVAYFRSNQSGSWSTASNWDYSSDNSSWATSTKVPDNTNSTSVTIQNGHTITLGSSISVPKLTINAGGALSASPSVVLTIPTGFSITNNGTLTLKSDATGTASIGTSAGTITGNITVERYLTALRKYRFLASPVVGGTALQWRDNAGSTSGKGIQITGTGGATNNFDVSTSNTNSAFSYDETAAGNSTTVGTGATNDAGWTAFTSGTMALANGAGYRVLVRGDRTISLTGGSATPNTTTIAVTGTYPTTPVTINLTKTGANTNSGYNLIGNPLPSAISWAGLTKTNVGTTYYVYQPSSNSYQSWNGTTGSATDLISSSQAFFVTATAATGSVGVPESAKSNSAGASFFKTVLQNHLKLTLKYDSMNYDDQYIHFRNDATNSFDNDADGYHLMNAGINFSSTDANGVKYSINSLADLTTDTEVQLNMENTAKANYSLTINGLNSFDGAQIFLKDKLNNSITAIDKEGFTMNITHDSLSDMMASSRFSVLFKKSTTGINNIAAEANHFTLFPNPAISDINLILNNNKSGNYSYVVMNQLGMNVAEGRLDFNNSHSHSVSVDGLSSGVYYIRLSGNNSNQTIKFIK